MRVQFGQHNPVDRRCWRHEIDFVILRPEGPSQKGRFRLPLKWDLPRKAGSKNLVEMRSFAVARAKLAAQDDVIGTAMTLDEAGIVLIRTQ